MQQTSFQCIHTDSNEYFSNFLKESINSFYEELFLYIHLNEDPVILEYANEQTLASLFVNGLIRKDSKELPTVTAVQEYSLTPDDESKNKRPDIFLRKHYTAIWIECKYDRNNINYNEDHFNIEKWMEWDQKDILTQVQTYYEFERLKLNNSFQDHYIVTMAFKRIKADKDIHLQKCEEMRNEINAAARECYYAVEFLQKEEGESMSEGLEVYGTFEKKK